MAATITVASAALMAALIVVSIVVDQQVLAFVDPVH